MLSLQALGTPHMHNISNIAPHTIKHILEDCKRHNQIRQHNIHSLRDMWDRTAFLKDVGLFGQAT